VWEVDGDVQAAINEAKAAGVYIFGRGIVESVARLPKSALVLADGAVIEGGSPQQPAFNGGITVY